MPQKRNAMPRKRNAMPQEAERYAAPSGAARAAPLHQATHGQSTPSTVGGDSQSLRMIPSQLRPHSLLLTFGALLDSSTGDDLKPF